MSAWGVAWAWQLPVQDVPAQIVPVTTYGLYLALGLAAMTAIQIIVTSLINRFADAKKETRDAARAVEAARLAAELKSAEKAEDWRRQDEVADRVAAAAKQAADAAQLLVIAQHETIARTDEVARLAADHTQRVMEQLHVLDEQGKKIHILVNSDMTAARTAERDSLRALVLSLRNALALSIKLKIKPAGTEIEEIEKMEQRVEELDQILADRHAAQLIVEAEARVSGTSPDPPELSHKRRDASGTALSRDQESRPSDTIVTDGTVDRRQLPPIAAKTAETALKQIEKNTLDTAKNTASAAASAAVAAAAVTAPKEK